ncbi:amidase [Stappia stellulata]|uniref:amidase n=1 Tax=Stappia stellulata TaxID=71235 RepID=UPI0003F4ECC6|nr:amidase [Stappia stellulata]
MLSALDVARRLDAGTLSLDALYDEVEAAIARREEEIGAFVSVDIAAARTAAHGAYGPLAGMPIGVKDNIETGDRATAYGSAIHQGYRPAVDAAVVALARRAGATIVGKTVTTEFAFFSPGPTRNPHNLEHTPGGSSSGSAAGVAAGFFPLGLGTQTGGSVVRPAAFCGIAGFKPSFGCLPTVGVKIFSWSLDTVGIFARSIADAAFGAGVLADRDWRVDGEVPAPPRLGFVEPQPWAQADEEMAVALERVRIAAERAGAAIRPVALPPVLREAFAAHQTIQDYEATRALAAEVDLCPEKLSPVLRQTLDAGAAITATAYDDAQRTADQARRAFADILSEVDVLVTPSAPGAAPIGLASTGSSVFNRVWTLIGAPSANVPGMTGATGLPLGVQTIGAVGADGKMLKAAHWLEKCVAAAADN